MRGEVRVILILVGHLLMGSGNQSPVWNGQLPVGATVWWAALLACSWCSVCEWVAKKVVFETEAEGCVHVPWPVPSLGHETVNHRNRQLPGVHSVCFRDVCFCSVGLKVSGVRVHDILFFPCLCSLPALSGTHNNNNPDHWASSRDELLPAQAFPEHYIHSIPVPFK